MLNRIQIAVLLLLVTAAIGLWIFMSGNATDADPVIDTSSFESPRNVVIDFYDVWLETVSTADQPTVLEFVGLNADLRTELNQLLAEGPAVDPLFCAAGIPDNFGTKVVFTTDTNAEIAVTARGLDTFSQALVLLTATPERWEITSITCSNGETAPDVEFTFDQTGNLLKNSLQAPLDSNRWHLVYTRDGQAGYAAPLFFAADSMCIAADGTSAVCNPDNLSEPQGAIVKGQMTEAGVEVTTLEVQ